MEVMQKASSPHRTSRNVDLLPLGFWTEHTLPVLRRMAPPVHPMVSPTTRTRSTDEGRAGKKVNLIWNTKSAQERKFQEMTCFPGQPFGTQLHYFVPVAVLSLEPVCSRGALHECGF
uniref:Uncharacterized protein n=1 Tax=Rhodosorus marinus TaxID=101924 RepID=A0A7S2ZSB9_9RHOD